MSESRLHNFLVARLVEWVENSIPKGEGKCILTDSGNNSAQDRPPKVGEFYPDVFLHDLPNRQMIIGEAKTPRDLETKHSYQQIESFLEECNRKNAIFVLAVPWDLTRTAKNMIKRIKEKKNIQSVKSVVLDQISLDMDI